VNTSVPRWTGPVVICRLELPLEMIRRFFLRQRFPVRGADVFPSRIVVIWSRREWLPALEAFPDPHSRAAVRRRAIDDCEIAAMKFIEMTGKSLAKIVKDDELHVKDLPGAGVRDDTVVRVNQQGDVEVRLRDGWDVIGGLLGNFEERVRKQTGLDWA
jgi:hypothetical protein